MSTLENQSAHPTTDREQHLMVRTLQQEEELRQLKEQLAKLQNAVKSTTQDGSAGPTPPHSTSAPRRPQTARPVRTEAKGENAAATNNNTADSSFPMPMKETHLYGTFPIERQTPNPNGPQRGPSEGHTAVTLDGRVVVFGGTNGSVISNELWAYNIASARWSRITAGGNFPRGRYGHTAVAYKGTMFIYGGFGPGGVKPLVHSNSNKTAASASPGAKGSQCGLLGSLFAYNNASRQWTEITLDRTEPVKGHTATMYRNTMYIFGGCVVEGRTQAVRAIDLDRQCWLPLEALNPQLVAAEREATSNASHKPDGLGKRSSPPSMALLARSDIPAARSGHSAENFFAPNNHCSMIVFGGRLRKDAFANDVCSYEYETGNWLRQYCGGSIPAARSDHSASIYKEWMMVLGGYSLEERSEAQQQQGGVVASAQPSSSEPSPRPNHIKIFYSDMFVLNLVSWTWTKVEFDGPERPLGLCGHSACLYESPSCDVNTLVIGGFGNMDEEALQNQFAAADQDDYHHDGQEQQHGTGGGGMRIAADGSAFGSLDDLWSVSVCKVPKKEQRQQVPQRPMTARTRQPARTEPSQRPVSARRHDRSPSAGGTAAQQSERKPFSIQTCGSVGKCFSDIPSNPAPPPVVRRTEYEIEEIKRRLAVTQVERIRENRRLLAEKYLKRDEPNQFEADEQEESIDRLYYQQMEWREQKAKDLEERYAARVKHNKVDQELIDDTILRLTQVPEHDEAKIYGTKSLGKKKAVRLGKEELDDSVKRLFQKSVEDQRTKHKQLEEKYLWGTKAARKKASAADVQALVERLNAKPPPRMK